MPRQPDSFEAAVARSVEEYIHRVIPAVAEKLGPLPDTVEPTRKEKQDLWNLRTDKVPPEMTDQLADEALAMCLEEYQQRGEPIPDEATLAKLVAAKISHVLYPYNQEIYGRGNPRPEARVKEAERYQREWQKQHQQPTIETVEPVQPAALPAPSTMPTLGQPMPPADPMATPEPVQGGVY